jgi:hypothetical protein
MNAELDSKVEIKKPARALRATACCETRHRSAISRWWR